MKNVQIGLERLRDHSAKQQSIKGNVALLTHHGAVADNLCSSTSIVKNIFGKRLKKIFGPQHGFVCDVQDNMVETDDFIHPYYNIPVYSLYGKTRTPTDESLEGIDSLIVDLQDVGTRVYTYISTLTLVLRQCAQLSISVFVLDRPNPIGGEIIEGPILNKNWMSFVGLLPLPQRHSLTLGEVALFAQKHDPIDVHLTVVKMTNWKRHLLWKDLGRPWINPSPNLPTPESALTYPGTVLFEGTNLSEGRGTTRSLEMLGHPQIKNPEALKDSLEKEWFRQGFHKTCFLRPVIFRPMFQKHTDKSCGGFHIQPLHSSFPSWSVGKFLLKMFKKELGSDFSWDDGPYEYEYNRRPIDLINGGEELRKWVEDEIDDHSFESFINQGQEKFKEEISDILLYP